MKRLRRDDVLEMRGDNPYEVSGTIHEGCSGGDGRGSFVSESHFQTISVSSRY